jgi:D-alanyl-lipoteichoic acid acyltransferase DltB (MBOAT superfamily)
MLFSSNVFIFCFLPVALVLFYGAARFGRTSAMATLALLSLGFYTYWKPEHLWVLLFSIGYNFVLGRLIQNDRAAGRTARMRAWLWLGLIVDLGLLIYFKYTMFLVANINAVLGTGWDVGTILLPLGISFFTFQKIAYLVDSARGDAQRTGLIEFGLFAAFFPQLIAGPIVHYTEVIPQFRRRLFGRLLSRNMMVGLAIFAIGLFKKTVIADSIASYLDPMYAAAVAHPGAIDFRTGWLITVSFTLQVYFDFSGYSDMAIGLARMFGILLPLNFHSPLRAASVIDYWRRWHMTLQRFIVTYVFQPLSLPFNRFVAQRGLGGWTGFALGVGLPSFITFFILGVWHGAGWTFVLFGVLNAGYICVNEAWRERRKRINKALRRAQHPIPEIGTGERAAYHALTLLAMLVANMVFRATNLADAFAILRAMAGLNGLATVAHFDAFSPTMLYVLIATGAVIVALMPNTQQIMARYRPAVNYSAWSTEAPALLNWRWQPDAIGIGFIGVALFFGVMLVQRGQSVFLYFNF